MNGSFLTLRRSLRVFSLVLGVSGIFLMPVAGYAQTALSWARIETLRNRVQLIPSGRRPRLARIEDTMTVGDALRTASASRAELRFNDGSLARIGQRATFRFTPNTRNFQLSNGTMLLLIPPGRGRTTIQTPNAVTGIQGSALFVRTIPETDTTIVGALTNNPAGPMMAYNEDGSQQQPLYAGQMVVVEGDQISQMFEFDLMTFYQTSGLVEGLSLDKPNESLGTDELDEVRQEILDAIDAQEPVEGPDTTDNPAFTRTPVLSSGTTDTPLAVAFPEYEGSPAQGYYLQAEAESSPANNAAALSPTTPTASINNTGDASQTSFPPGDFDNTSTATSPTGGGSSQPTQTPEVNPGQVNPSVPQQPAPAQETPRTPVPAGEFIWQNGASSEVQSTPENITTQEIAPALQTNVPETTVPEDAVPETLEVLETPEPTPESAIPEMPSAEPAVDNNLNEDTGQSNNAPSNP